MEHMEMEFRELSADEIDRALFSRFERRQRVTKCLRKTNDGWVSLDDPFIDRWSEEKYAGLIVDLKATLRDGGAVFGAFESGVLKGFSAVSAGLFGTDKAYIDMTALHVSEELRGRGIGRTLFLLAADWAREHDAKKLYISGHSAVETQAFYRAMGCVEAKEYSAAHVAAEPCDCQLEYVL